MYRSRRALVRICCLLSVSGALACAEAGHGDSAAEAPLLTPRSGDLRVGSDNDPTLNGELKIAQSDIRPLIREQLTLLRGELQAAMGRGVRDRNTRIHLTDALLRIDQALAP